MSAEPESKYAYVYRVVVRDAQGPRPVEVDWAALSERYEAYSLTERTHDNVVYFFSAHEDDRVAVSMHEPLAQDFLSTLSAATGTVEDILPDKELDGPGDQVARSTAVVPLGRQGHFAYVRGVVHAPSHTRLRELLKAAFELEEGEHWEVEPVMDSAAIKQFEAADGLTAFRSKFRVQHDLLSMLPKRRGIFKPVAKIATWLESDLDVELTIKLPPSSREHQGKRREFHRLTRNNLPELVGKDSRAKATVVQPNGQSEVLDLVEHKLVVSFEIPPASTERRSFTALRDGLLSIASDIEATLNALLDTDINQPLPTGD